MASDWQLWRTTLQQILHLGWHQQLGKPLGNWCTGTTGWFMDTTTNALWHLTAQAATHHGIIPKCGRTLWFYANRSPEPPPAMTHRATVTRKGNHIRLTGYGKIAPAKWRLGRTIDDICAIPFNREWALDLTVQGNLNQLLREVTHGSGLGVSDGSYRDGRGAAAWVVEGCDGRNRLLGQICTPGLDTDHSSFRSELAGLYSLLFTLWHLTAGTPRQRF